MTEILTAFDRHGPFALAFLVTVAAAWWYAVNFLKPAQQASLENQRKLAEAVGLLGTTTAVGFSRIERAWQIQATAIESQADGLEALATGDKQRAAQVAAELRGLSARMSAVMDLHRPTG